MELKPCPFCGGEKIMFEWEANYVSSFCEKCGSRAAFKTSLEEAAASWNARTERTCKMIPNGEKDFAATLSCSMCGNVDSVYAISAEEFNYCPNCGAKVVE